MADVSGACNTSPSATLDFSHSCALESSVWAQAHFTHGIALQAAGTQAPGPCMVPLALNQVQPEMWGGPQSVGRGAGRWVAQPPPSSRQSIHGSILYASQEDHSGDLDNVPYVRSPFPASSVLLQTAGSWHSLPDQLLAPTLHFRLHSQENPNSDPSSFSLSEPSTAPFRWSPCICWYLQGWQELLFPQLNLPIAGQVRGTEVSQRASRAFHASNAVLVYSFILFVKR